MSRPVISAPIRLSDLRGAAAPIDLRPDAAQAAALAERLGVDALRKVRLSGRLAPVEGGWALEATLGATLVQPCGVTLEPVTTRVEEPVSIRYLAGYVAPTDGTDEEGVEMADDEVEPLPDAVDPGAILEEALALAVPVFPRAPGADALELRAGPPGAAPLDDDAIKPFAGLAGLRDRLAREEGEGG